MTDFFERQDSARKNTLLLIALFLAAVAIIILSVNLVVTFVYYFAVSLDRLGYDVTYRFWDHVTFTSVSVITLAVVISGTVYKINKLSAGGGKGVAKMLGGRLLTRNTTELSEKRVLNIVEEMAIAAGLPVPDVYVLDGEDGINAFAAGYSLDDAVICVTRGTLNLLSRDEMQGVIAHEFSHILNTDMLINIRLIGWLHGILLIGLTGRALLRGFGRTRYTRGTMLPFVGGGMLMAVGYIGVFFGNIIKSAISRQREYLADASAVQFTRNPLGLAGALKKVGGLLFGSRLSHPKAAQISHLFFSNGVTESVFGFMRTHPPLEERIRKLDPYFSGVYPKVETPSVKAPALPRAYKPTKIQKPAGLPDTGKIISIAAVGAILDSVGKPMEHHVSLARKMIEGFPEVLGEALKSPSGACLAIYRLLLDRDPAIRTRQFGFIKEIEGMEAAAGCAALYEQVPSINPRARLPIMDLAMPSLRQLTDEQYAKFKQVLRKLIEADRRLTIFEYVVNYVIVRHLDAHFLEPRRKVTQIYSLKGLPGECSLVLSMFARLNKRKGEQAEKAFEEGVKTINRPRLRLEMVSLELCNAREMDKAFERLSLASPNIRRLVLAACLNCMLYDKVISVDEIELFRATAEALGVPIPPWAIEELDAGNNQDNGHSVR